VTLLRGVTNIRTFVDPQRSSRDLSRTRPVVCVPQKGTLLSETRSQPVRRQEDAAIRLSKLILDSYLSKLQRKSSFERRDDPSPSLEIVARATL
jgi:hypothetical protein